MKITPVPHGLDLGISHALRSGGLHMSDIYNDLFQELEPKRYKRDEAPDPLRIEAGLALEQTLEQGLKQRLGNRPGEFITTDGVVYSPDLLIFNGETRLGEIKLTWMSSREVPRETAAGFPPKFDKYFVQMKAYCHHLETPYARLLAYFVNGDYRPPRPELLAWDITFTAQELRDNYQMLLNHARNRGML